MTGQASKHSRSTVLYRVLAAAAGLLGSAKVVGLVLFEAPYGSGVKWFVMQAVLAGALLLCAVWLWRRSSPPG